MPLACTRPLRIRIPEHSLNSSVLCLRRLMNNGRCVFSPALARLKNASNVRWACAIAPRASWSGQSGRISFLNVVSLLGMPYAARGTLRHSVDPERVGHTVPSIRSAWFARK